MASSSDENDVDVEGNEDFDSAAGLDKRAHHNLLERKRRDHIKDSFAVLRDSIPSLEGEKASRAQILNKATEFIKQMRQKNTAHAADLDRIRKDNEDLERQIRALEEEESLSSATLQLSGGQGGVNFVSSHVPSSQLVVGENTAFPLAGGNSMIVNGKVSSQRAADENAGDDAEGQHSPLAKRKKRN